MALLCQFRGSQAPITSSSTKLYPTVIALASPREPWEALGFSVRDDNCITLKDIVLQLHTTPDELDEFDGSRRGSSDILGWAFNDNTEATRRLERLSEAGSAAATVAGIPLVHPRSIASDTSDGVHSNGVYEIDHIVVYTHDLVAAKADLATLGMAMKREIVNDKKHFRQTFYRPNQTIIEVISTFSPAESRSTPPPNPFQVRSAGVGAIWGVTFSCSDIDQTYSLLQSCTKPPHEALQRGRRMIVVDPRKQPSIPMRLAFMSPHVKS